jgi:hypothetical protein
LFLNRKLKIHEKKKKHTPHKSLYRAVALLTFITAMFHHDKTEVSIKESHRHRHDKMKYELKEKHHDGGHIGMISPPIVPSMGMGMGTVLPAPLPIVAPTAGHHDKFSLKIKEKVHGRRNSATTTTTTTTATPAGMVSETIANGPFIAPVAGMGLPAPVENTYVYHDAPQFLSPDMPPVTTTYVVHEPVLPAGLSAPTALPAPISPIAPIAPMATAMPVAGKHELKIKEKIRGGGAVGATVAPIPEFGAPLVPAPALGKHDKFQFKLKEKHRA